MEQPNNIVPRDRTNGDGSIATLQPRSTMLPLDMMPREVHLLDHLMILRKHMWLVLAFALAVVTIVTIATYRIKPEYDATARIEIDRENTNVLPFNGNSSDDAYEDFESYIATQSMVLTSETLALQTIKSLNLDRDPRFGGQLSNPSAIEVAAVKGSDGAQSAPPALGAFLSGLKVVRVPNSRLLDVTFSATDPKLATQIVNAHINNFIEQNWRSHYAAATQASTWLSSQLDDLKSKVEDSEDARINYERTNQIWTINEKGDVTNQKLADLNQELTAAQSDRISKEAVFQLVQSGNYDAIPAVRNSPVIQDILKRQSDLSSQYTEALNQYGPKFPKVIRLQAQLKELDELTANEKKNIANQVEADYRGARQREILLVQALDQQKTESSAMADKMVQYNILQRDADANKQLYDGLLQKLKEAGISAGLRSSNIRVVDNAFVPDAPSRPDKRRNITLALLVGLVGGIALALLREYMDSTVKNPDDVEILSGLPTLAVVPSFDSLNGHAHGRRMPKLLKSPAPGENDVRVELVSHLQPKSQMAEAFRSLRTSLLLSQADHPPQVILLTSSLPREGKTTAAVNLAITLAQLGDKTLLIDGDLRKPGVSHALGMADGRHVGLSSYLVGVSTLDLVIASHPNIPNMDVIPTGPIPPNPADLLSSHRLSEMISQVRSRYKFIVIDSPPIMAATDALILSVVAEGVLVVVRSGETPKQAFARARDLLASVKSPVLGVVLNAVDASASNYYYSYRYYPYSYESYGDEGHDQERPTKDKTGVTLTF